MLTVAVICCGHTNAIRDFHEIIHCPMYKEALCNRMKELSIKKQNVEEPSINKIEELIKKISLEKPSVEESSINETAVNESSGNESSGIESIEEEASESELTEKGVNEKKPKFHDVMFFSENSELCRYHLKTMKSCGKPDCSVGYLRKIIDLLDSATHTLDICLFSFTCGPLKEAVYAAKDRGVNVRYITEDSTIIDKGTTFLRFILEDIPVRCRDSANCLMHHKFCVIDNRILITGSANWTLKAFFGNCENIIVTDDSGIVQKFQDEFTKLWHDFEEGSYRCPNNTNVPKNNVPKKKSRNFRNPRGH